LPYLFFQLIHVVLNANLSENFYVNYVKNVSVPNHEMLSS